jgi:cyclic pyranopterin phosphate synthase
MITAAEILALLRTRYRLSPADSARGSAPAERWVVDDGPACVGIIASVTRPFCRACARTRVTADGQVRNCLFSTSETDLRALLRAGASDDEIADGWRAAMWGKAAGHGIGTPGYTPASRSMSAIGG